MSELNVWLAAAPANQVKSKKPKARPAATPPADDPSSSSDSDSSSSKSTSSHASSHQKKKKLHKKKSTSQSSSSPRSGKSSVSSPASKSASRNSNSSSDSEASSDSSTSQSNVSTSDSSRSRHRRHRKKSSKSSRHRRRRKKSSKSNSCHRRRSPDSGRRHRSKHHSPEAGAAASVHLFSKDPSTGDNRSIFDLSLSDTTKVEEALCPPGMASKDRAGFASCLTDVAAMPGTYHRSSTMEKTDMEAMMEGTVALVAQATGNSLILPDGQWKSQRKARLSAIKSSSDLLTLWENLAEAESEIFAQQDDRIRSYLYDRHYSTSEIDQFLASGLFIRIITVTYNNYRSLLQTLLSHTNVLGFSGLASELLKYHGKKLLQLRLFSPSYFSFLLRQYVYLRDAAASKFSHVNVIAPLVQELFSRAPAATEGGGGNGSNGNGGGGNGGGGDPKCSFCQNKECHSKLGIPPDASKCPFKLAHLTRSQCRKAAKAFVAAFSPSADKDAAIQAAIETAKTPQDQ
eukprot:scaffold22621_cov36-Cyclotella_meneghiniana.AAC.5